MEDLMRSKKKVKTRESEFKVTFFYVASGADGMHIPQGLHKGSVHLDVAIGDR